MARGITGDTTDGTEGGGPKELLSEGHIMCGLAESVIIAIENEHSGVLVTNLDTKCVLSADDVNDRITTRREFGHFKSSRCLKHEEEEVEVDLFGQDVQAMAPTRKTWLSRYTSIAQAAWYSAKPPQAHNHGGNDEHMNNADIPETTGLRYNDKETPFNNEDEIVGFFGAEDSAVL